MLVNFLRNQADASASWSILGKKRQISHVYTTTDLCLGLTVRLAQGIGLHYAPNPYESTDITVDKAAIVKHAIW